MRDHGSWSFHLGRWSGVPVRVHMFFALFAAATMLFSWQASQQPGSGDLVPIAAVSLLVLFVSGLLHEVGHLYTTRRLRGESAALVVGPLVGLSSFRPPRDPSAEFLCHAAGPLVNGLICLLCVPFLMLQSGVNLFGLMHPLNPQGLALTLEPAILIRLVFWINWLMLLVNLLPVFPFDGGRMFRALLLAVRPQMGRPRAAKIVAGMAKIVAVGLLIVACFFFWNQSGEYILPIWFALVLLSIFVFFGAKSEEMHEEEEREEDDLFGYDFSQGYVSLERSSNNTGTEKPPAGALTGWLQQRRKQKLERQREQEAEEERCVDEILKRLHSHGMDSLSPQDRSLLKRVSRRYRDRQAD